jgi:hypothetical protein
MAARMELNGYQLILTDFVLIYIKALFYHDFALQTMTSLAHLHEIQLALDNATCNVELRGSVPLLTHYFSAEYNGTRVKKKKKQ